MGKSIASIISSLVTVGIIGFLIYYCCLRRRRNNGRTVQTINGPIVQPPQQLYPVNPGQPAHIWSSYGQPSSITNPQFQHQYNHHQQPPSNFSTPPYPTQTQNQQHLGMPMPGQNFGPMNGNQQYSPSAPASDELPPPYSSVVRGS